MIEGTVLRNIPGPIENVLNRQSGISGLHSQKLRVYIGLVELLLKYMTLQ
jgi:hypothetical protein